MSLDYPFYEELVRRRHPAAKWWLVGDRLYYLGLLPTLAAFSGLLPSLGYIWLVDRNRGGVLFVLCAVVLLVGPLVWLLGAHLKEVAYRMAERDGIRPEDHGR